MERPKAYLDRVCGEGVFTRANIDTPSMHGGKDGTVVRGGKVPMLRALTTALVGADGGGGTETEAAVRAAPRVLFFDDDEKNVTGAREHGYVMSVLTDACFTREKWDEVKAGLGMEALMDGA